jgi:glycine/D-amino acid oxidase-like deaminating enzyme
MRHSHDVVVVGAGTTGAAAAYHLSQAGVGDILCLEMGSPGEGRSAMVTVPGDTPLLAQEEATYMPHASGSRVFAGGSQGPRTIKMIVTLPPYLTLDGFADLFGWDGVRTYLELARQGRDLELKLAAQLLPDPARQLRQCGSLMVCNEEQAGRLRLELEWLQNLECPCEWWDRERVIGAHGSAAGYTAGIWFAQDARIDSSSYARALVEAAVASGAATLRQSCAPMVAIDTVADGDQVEIELADGEVIRARQAIVATGGMYLDRHLAGLLTPRYSYLVALPHRDPGPLGGMQCPDSANFFTLGFSHDWCVADDFVRISGEDHYSGLKSPRAGERCGRLARWGWNTYPYLDCGVPYPSSYGIYSETADYMPLVGRPNDRSRVLYMVGCNAWGQASLSAAAALAPALLGYRELTPSETRTARLFSMRRFSGSGTLQRSLLSRG